MIKQTRIEKAQNAYSKKDIEASKKAHTEKAIVEHLEKHTKEKGKYLKDVVFGASDGIVTTFAIVSGVEGAHLPSSVILLLGFAKVFADAISMAVGNYLSTKSEVEYIKKEREREEWEIEHLPEGEVEEIRQIYKKKGFKGKDLEKAVKIITSDKKIWTDTMMLHELGLVESDKTPVTSSIATFFSFIIVGVVPLIAFVLALFIPGLAANSFLLSIILTGITLFIIGALRSSVTGVKWLRSGLEMLVVGGLAAGVAYAIGFFLRGFGL